MNMSFPSVSLTTSILFCILIGVIFRYYWGRRRLYYYASKVPGPPAWPIIGNILYFSGGNDVILDTLGSMLAMYGSIFRTWLGTRLYFLTTTPIYVEIVITQALEKDYIYDKTIGRLLANGLITGPVEIWKRHRKVIQPTFNQRNLNSFVSIFSKHFQLMVQKLKRENDDERMFDVHPSINKCTLEIVGETLMGSSVEGTTAEFEESLEQLENMHTTRVMKVWMLPDFIWELTSLSRVADRHIAIVRDFLSNVIQTKKREYRSNKSNNVDQEEFDKVDKKKPFLEYLVELSEEGGNWTDEQLIEESITLMVGGSHTSDSTSSFALLMLGMYQHLQEKVYREIYEIFGDSNRHCTPKDLGKMVYLERFLKETMRLFPVVPIILRRLDRDIQLGPYLLPEGSGIIIPIFHIHRDPDLWPEPLKFDPDRFLPKEIAKRHPYSFIPFSGGPRNCIGMNNAMMTMKTMISTFLRSFHLSTDYKRVEDVTLTMEISLKAIHGWNISLRSRQ